MERAKGCEGGPGSEEGGSLHKSKVKEYVDKIGLWHKSLFWFTLGQAYSWLEKDNDNE